MSDSPDLGPLCPDCGTPLRSPSAPCARCGGAAATPAEWQGGVLTPFGYGVCGAAIAAGVALIVNLSLAVGHYQMLLVMAGAALGATVCSQVGKRLVPHVRVSYERLLLSLLAGGFVAVLFTWLSPAWAGLSPGVWLAVTCASHHLAGRRARGLHGAR